MDNPRLGSVRQIWDNEAANFDDEADHGLRDPQVRDAWRNRLVGWLSPNPLAVLDIGCGTGSLSVLMAALGHNVTGIDYSPAMLSQAKAKAASLSCHIDFREMDAADPSFPPAEFDAVLCRHVLWALPEPAQVLRRWINLLKPAGRLVLIEGYWFTNAGLHAAEILEALPPSMADVEVENLSDQIDLWGRAVTDERYVVRAFPSAGR